MAASNCAAWPRRLHRQRPRPDGGTSRRRTRLYPGTVPALRIEQRLGSVVGEALSVFRRGSGRPAIAFRFLARIVFERSVAPKSRTQTDLDPRSRVAAPAFSAHVYFEGRLSRRPRGLRLLRQHRLVRISDPRENARSWKTADSPAATVRLVGAARRPNQLCERAQNDSALEREIPVLEIFDVASDTVFDISVIPCFPAKSPHLRQTGDAWLHKRTHMVVAHEFRKLLVVFDLMRLRADDAHVAEEHVPKLRHFIDAQFAEPFSQRIDALIDLARLTR